MHLKVGFCQFVAEGFGGNMEQLLLDALAEDIGFNYTKIKYPWPLPAPDDMDCKAGKVRK